MAIENIEKNLIGKETIDVGDKLGSFHESFEGEFDRDLGVASTAIEKTRDTVDDISNFIEGTNDGAELVKDIAGNVGETAGQYFGGDVGELAVREIDRLGADIIVGTNSLDNVCDVIIDDIVEQSGQDNVAVSAVKLTVNTFDEIVDYQQGSIDGAQLAYNIGEQVAYSVGDYLGGEEWATQAVEIYEVVVDVGAEIVDTVSEAIDTVVDKVSEASDAAKAKIASIFD